MANDSNDANKSVDWRPARHPDDIIGYEYKGTLGDDPFEVFRCAWHHDFSFDGWTPVTARQAYEGYYSCDRMGCEYTWWHKTIRQDHIQESIGMRRVGSDGEQSEAAWQEQIVQCAELHGWEVHHVHDARRSIGDGFPDLVLAKIGHPVLYVELKRHNGVLSREQRHWLAVLSATQGAVVYLWRAPRLKDGNALWLEITQILASGPDRLPAAYSRWVPMPDDVMSKQERAARTAAKRFKAQQKRWAGRLSKIELPDRLNEER